VLLCETFSHFLRAGPRGAETNPAPRAPGVRFLYRYFQPYRKYLGAVGVRLLAASLIGLLAPFLTQAMIITRGNQNRELVYTLLIAQLVLFMGGPGGSDP